MRNDNLKSVAFLYLQMILLWIFASMLLLFLRNYGVDQAPAENLIEGVGPKQFLPVSMALGVMAGIVYTTIEFIFERPYFQRHSPSGMLME